MERRGRFTSIETHRTAEEQKRFIKRIIDSRPKLLTEIKEANRELLELVHKYNSLELLAQLWFQNSVGDPDEYKEYSFEGRGHYIEHLAALELKDSGYKLQTVEMPGGAATCLAQSSSFRWRSSRRESRRMAAPCSLDSKAMLLRVPEIGRAPGTTSVN